MLPLAAWTSSEAKHCREVFVIMYLSVLTRDVRVDDLRLVW